MARSLSQSEVCTHIGIDLRTYKRWESQGAIPQPESRRKLCEFFGVSLSDLGYDSLSLLRARVGKITMSPTQSSCPSATKTQQINVSGSSIDVEPPDWAVWFGLRLAQILRAISLWSGQAMLCDDIQMVVDQEIKVMDEMLWQYQIEPEQSIPRRQALVTIAGLPTTLLTIWKQSGVMTDNITEEFIPQCAASITACWYLLRGKGLKVVSEILPQFAPLLTAVALRPSKYQQMAARLATQTSILQAIVAMHRLDPITREKHCNDAICYSRISEDRKLQAAALMYLGYTFSFCYLPRKPEKAIPLFLQGLNVLGEEESLLRSDILMGLAEAYAQCKEEKQALHYMELAQAYFPAYPEHDLSYIYADCGWPVLYQWEGKMYLELAEQYPDFGYQRKAADALMQSIGVQSISERSMNETIVYQADVTRVLGELDVYVDYLETGAQMALTLGSRKRFTEALMVYQRTPEKWLAEQHIQALAKDVFRQFPTRKANNP